MIKSVIRSHSQERRRGFAKWDMKSWKLSRELVEKNIDFCAQKMLAGAVKGFHAPKFYGESFNTADIATYAPRFMHFVGGFP